MNRFKHVLPLTLLLSGCAPPSVIFYGVQPTDPQSTVATIWADANGRSGYLMIKKVDGRDPNAGHDGYAQAVALAPGQHKFILLLETQSRSVGLIEFRDFSLIASLDAGQVYFFKYRRNPKTADYEVWLDIADASVRCTFEPDKNGSVNDYFLVCR